MNAAAHQWAATMAVAGVIGHAERPVRGGNGLAAVATRLPDVLEPAVHPKHRQFFHSVALAAFIAAGWRRLYEWQPQDDGERPLRTGMMVCAGAYLCHLALDAMTAKSLPLLGKSPFNLLQGACHGEEPTHR